VIIDEKKLHCAFANNRDHLTATLETDDPRTAGFGISISKR
jgi:hypothetical protein